MQNISPIKQRILQYVDYLGIAKRSFYAKTGISRGTLDNSSGITEDIIAKFIAIYPNVSPIWLLTGEGEMIIKNEYSEAKENNDADACESISQYIYCKSCQEKDKLIKAQQDHIDTLKKMIESLTSTIQNTAIKQTG